MLNDVLEFWFEEIEPAQWWKKDDHFDQQVKERFERMLKRAKRGELFGWRTTARGRLAEIILLDQFSRNIYRDTAKAFAQDGMALVLAQEAVALGADKELEPRQRAFIYLPYMHSESRIIHEEALRLFDTEGLEENFKFEVAHKEIIDRFGRYPHRNAILGRESTEEELTFLAQPGSGF